jgi:hypothetical protein
VALDVDVSNWPVAVVTRAGEGDVLLSPALGDLLDRKERFALVLDIGRQSRAEQADLATWLQANKVRAQRFVLGCALVVPEATLAHNRDLIGSHPEAYPFPAWVAASRDECRLWVDGIVATSGPDVVRPPRR